MTDLVPFVENPVVEYEPEPEIFPAEQIPQTHAEQRTGLVPLPAYEVAAHFRATGEGSVALERFPGFETELPFAQAEALALLSNLGTPEREALARKLSSATRPTPGAKSTFWSSPI